MRVSTSFKLTALMSYFDPKIIKFKKENGISHAKYVELTKRDFEIAGEMPFDEIMQLSPEEFNSIIEIGDKEPFRFELAQDGYRYFNYKNLYFKKYLDENGNIDMDKVNKAYENNCQWDDLDNNVVFRDVNNKEYTAKQLNLEEKYEHIKSYFPGVSKIRVNE